MNKNDGSIGNTIEPTDQLAIYQKAMMQKWVDGELADTKFTEIQKEAILSTLIFIAGEDGKISSCESEYINNIELLLGYNLDEEEGNKQAVLYLTDNGVFSTLNSLNGGQKTWFIVAAIGMMRIDITGVREKANFTFGIFRNIGIADEEVVKVWGTNIGNVFDNISSSTVTANVPQPTVPISQEPPKQPKVEPFPNTENSLEANTIYELFKDGKKYNYIANYRLDNLGLGQKYKVLERGKKYKVLENGKYEVFENGKKYEALNNGKYEMFENGIKVMEYYIQTYQTNKGLISIQQRQENKIGECDTIKWQYFHGSEVTNFNGKSKVIYLFTDSELHHIVVTNGMINEVQTKSQRPLFLIKLLFGIVMMLCVVTIIVSVVALSLEGIMIGSIAAFVVTIIAKSIFKRPYLKGK